MRTKLSSQKRQQGASLIEVLVATLILGIAVLGYAGLEVTGLKITDQAFVRERATYLAVEAKERIRMNRGQSDFYFNSASWGNVGQACTSGCTEEEVAQRDINELMELADQYLPSGDMGVEVCETQKCIVVSWGENTAADSCTEGEDCIVMLAYEF